MCMFTNACKNFEIQKNLKYSCDRSKNKEVIKLQPLSCGGVKWLEKKIPVHKIKGNFLNLIYIYIYIYN